MSSSFDEFENRVVVITGGSSGIGRAAALAFGSRGVRVALGSRRAEECEETVLRIKEQGGEAIFVRTDVRKSDSIRQLVQAAVDRWRRLDFAFNNAGILGSAWVPLVEYPEDIWDDVMNTNLKGIFMAMKFELPYMVEQGSGVIVNMASLAGLTGGKIGSAYIASKHGVNGLTRAAAAEYAASGIRINAVCPGAIKTDMTDRGFAGKEEAIRQKYPMGRFGTPDEVADAVVWLCSSGATFITGVTLPLDGGFLAR